MRWNTTFPVSVVTRGDFGRCAAEALSELVSEVSVVPEGPITLALQGLQTERPSAVILCTSVPIPSLSSEIDGLCHDMGIPFLSLTLKDDRLFVGPTVLPGVGPCWQCWAARELQADPSPAISQRLGEFYSRNPDSAPRGFVPSFALLGASWVARILKDLGTPLWVEHAGTIKRINGFGRSVVSGRVVGVDNCDRCGTRRDIKTRSYSGMRSELGHLWNQY
jgi:hypothetical protein